MTQVRIGLVLMILFLGSWTSAQDVVTLSDHGKVDGLGNYAEFMLHFRIDYEDGDIRFDSVLLQFNEYDTFVRPDAQGEYRYELWMKRDTTYILSIGNPPYRDSKNYWKAGDAWSNIRTVFLPDKPQRPIHVNLPYPEPTWSVFREWSNLGGSSFPGTMYRLGLEPIRSRRGDCQKFKENDYDFPFNYSVEYCDNSNFITLSYGVSLTEYETELDWARNMTEALKTELASYYKSSEEISGYTVHTYVFKYEDRTYKVSYMEDESCLLDDYVCYRVTVYIKWAD